MFLSSRSRYIILHSNGTLSISITCTWLLSYNTHTALNTTKINAYYFMQKNKMVVLLSNLCYFNQYNENFNKKLLWRKVFVSFKFNTEMNLSFDLHSSTLYIFPYVWRSQQSWFNFFKIMIMCIQCFLRRVWFLIYWKMSVVCVWV